MMSLGKYSIREQRRRECVVAMFGPKLADGKAKLCLKELYSNSAQSTLHLTIIQGSSNTFIGHKVNDDGVSRLRLFIPGSATMRYFLLHLYALSVMKEQDGWCLLPALRFLVCISGVNNKKP